MTLYAALAIAFLALGAALAMLPLGGEAHELGWMSVAMMLMLAALCLLLAFGESHSRRQFDRRGRAPYIVKQRSDNDGA